MLASREIEQLRADLQELQKGLNCSDATLQLRTEVTNLKNKVCKCFPSVRNVHVLNVWSCDCSVEYQVNRILNDYGLFSFHHPALFLL